jgi:NADPH:quinone reductase-like Zn-dependent oxidoreductase
VRAAQIRELNSPPEPVDVDDAVGLRIEAVGLNPVDIAVGAGRFYGGHPALPYSPGCEAVGRREDGACVYLFGDGRGISKSGFLVERVDVPDDICLLLPAGVDPALAAVTGIAGIAAWVPVAWKAKLTPADRVLVLGATGTVGRIALQAATLLGAAKVVGASRTPGDGVVGLDEIDAAFDGDGFTVCIDPIWGEPLARALGSAARQARIIHVGQAAGPDALLKSADVRAKELTIIGHSNFALSKEEHDRAYLELLDHLTAGRITLEHEAFALTDVDEAWAAQQAGGKAVVTL